MALQDDISLPPWQQLPLQQQLQQQPDTFTDLTTYREPSEFPPEEEESQDDARVERPPRPNNAVAEGDDAPLEEEAPEQEEEEVDADLIEDTIAFGDDQTQAVVIRGSKEAVERVKAERMLHADYTRKTTEVARQRDGIAEAVRQAQDQGRTQYVQQLETLKHTVHAALEPELRNVDWQKLASEDPQEFMRLSARGQQLKSHVDHIEQEQRNVAETQAKQDYGRLQEQIRQSQEIVSQTIPGWNDNYYSQVLNTAIQRYGFRLEEVQQIIDPRMIKVMSDLTKYHEGSDKRAIVKKKIAVTPKSIPASQAPQPRGADNSRIERQFQKTRSVSDAARLLESRWNKR